MIFRPLLNSDKETYSLIKKELERQEKVLEMIPSENNVSLAILEAIGSVLTNKYAEGYPGRRYYGGNEVVDQVENLAIERAKKLFKVPHANVQPYSGSPANFAVYLALCNIGDTIMGQNLLDGGHLTHGWKNSITGQIFNSVPYHVTKEGYVDLNEVERLADKNKPKIIWVGASAYSRKFEFKEIGRIADKVGAYCVADISHIAGLIASGIVERPNEYVDVITTTTHKTLRGPRGAIIMVTEKGLKKDEKLATKIDRAVFPGLQGGPHENIIAGISVALNEASTQGFKDYCEQTIRNAKVLSKGLIERGIEIVSGGTDNHMMLADLSSYGVGKGYFAEIALECANITVNKNTVPKEKSAPLYPSGIRLGTPSLTTRGMKENEMKVVANLIVDVIDVIKNYELPENNEEKKKRFIKFKEEIRSMQKIKVIRDKVIELCKKFPMYPGYNL